MNPEVLGVSIPLFGIVFGVAVAIVAILVGHRQRALRMELRHRERMAAMDKGLELPPEIVDPALDPANARPRHLLRGLIWTFLGIALIAMLYNLAGHDEAWIGGLPLAVGLGYLVFYFVEGRKESAVALERGPPTG
jgi:hypothetical protein